MIEKKCENCGAPFTPTTKKQRCCSQHCAYSKRSRDYSQVKTCPICKKEYKSLYNKSTCSAVCYEVLYREKKRVQRETGETLKPMVKCLCCGFEFAQRMPVQKYCSEKCSQKHYYQRYKEKKAASWKFAYQLQTTITEAADAWRCIGSVILRIN